MVKAPRYVFQPDLFPYPDAYSDLVDVDDAPLIERFLSRTGAHGAAELKLPLHSSGEAIAEARQAVGRFLAAAGMPALEASFAIHRVTDGKKEAAPESRLRFCWDGRKVFQTLMVSRAPAI